ncbi:MAG: Nif3-like dinuclear metal center hexameric protein [Hungatella hathewayi]|uniref:Nif3-like dinuclear metal center hexameric protein n=1 Tax=Hungatella TaxID=1649459 RepID=UPI0014863693|nr:MULTISPECIES: Nif3-like dinuclear metal center hexameric protein [Hungatella]MCI7381022.1 Nif3-like dinuclear metal center hexameric protein [Hungatella sp.]MDY6236179.1 Nif3-like dinuclear metal center hexameric protein [Hungatella hathewayi]
MKVKELIRDLKTWNDIPVDESNTCDTVKAGSVEKEVHRVALAMFGTVDVMKQVMDWNADLLIVHEPLYYDHMDKLHNFTIIKEKQHMITNSGLTIFRFHDYAHAMNPDMICAGEIKYAGLEGEIKERERFGVTSFILKEPLTSEELAEKLLKNLNLNQIRISGCTNKKGSRIACCFGSPGQLYELYENHDFILAGEISEWQDAEMARDAAALGYNKAILALGHETSERAGMMYMKELCADQYPNLEFKYFESKSVVSKEF